MSTQGLEQAFASTRNVLANVKPDQMDNGTPCESWKVRDLVNHIVAGSQWFGSTMDSGESGPMGGETPDFASGNYLETFDDEHFTDPRLVAFTGKVKIRHDATLDPRYPHGIPNRVTVTLADGRTLVREVEFPRGHAGNPMTDAEVEAKFRRVAEPRYGKAKADEILARCWDLEKLTSVTELIALFG